MKSHLIIWIWLCTSACNWCNLYSSEFHCTLPEVWMNLDYLFTCWRLSPRTRHPLVLMPYSLFINYIYAVKGIVRIQNLSHSLESQVWILFALPIGTIACQVFLILEVKAKRWKNKRTCKAERQKTKKLEQDNSRLWFVWPILLDVWNIFVWRWCLKSMQCNFFFSVVSKIAYV